MKPMTSNGRRTDFCLALNKLTGWKERPRMLRWRRWQWRVSLFYKMYTIWLITVLQITGTWPSGHLCSKKERTSRTIGFNAKSVWQADKGTRTNTSEICESVLKFTSFCSVHDFPNKNSKKAIQQLEEHFKTNPDSEAFFASLNVDGNAKVLSAHRLCSVRD